MRTNSLLLIATLVVLGGCANVPTLPSVTAFPGTGKTWEQFRADDTECQQYALNYIGGKTPHQVAGASAVESAAIGTVIGAAAGALIGRGGAGAAIGAGGGLLAGSAVGAGAAQRSAYSTQQHYDSAYLQCMYAKGEKVPVTAGFVPPPGAIAAWR